MNNPHTGQRALAIAMFLTVIIYAIARADEPTFLPWVERHAVTIQGQLRKALSMIGNPTCQDIYNLGAAWTYSWNPGTAEQCEGTPRYPMIRDLGDMYAITDTIGCNLPVMGFNEPNNDEPAGAEMTLSQLVAAWEQVEDLMPTEYLISPAMCPPHVCTQAPYYLDDFIGELDGPTWQRLAIHDYGYTSPYQSYQRFVSYYNSLPGTWPIWITEIGYWGSDSNAAIYLGLILDFIDSHPRIEYINWFKVGPEGYSGLAHLVNSDGSLTQTGEVWAAWH